LNALIRLSAVAIVSSPEATCVPLAQMRVLSPASSGLCVIAQWTQLFAEPGCTKSRSVPQNWARQALVGSALPASAMFRVRRL
jgi:hypothetical protein